MRLNLLETHDRLEYLMKDQSEKIAQGAEDCLKKNPDSLKLQEKSHYIYIFAHPRTHDNGVDKNLFWQPRLVKPKAETNSYLFRAQSRTDIFEVCWMIPPIELWEQYKKGNVCESNWCAWSIEQYLHNREGLEKPFEDDWSYEQAWNIFKSILQESVNAKNTKKNVAKHETSI
jgi:hypothetical protein